MYSRGCRHTLFIVEIVMIDILNSGIFIENPYVYRNTGVIILERYLHIFKNLKRDCGVDVIDKFCIVEISLISLIKIVSINITC